MTERKKKPTEGCHPGFRHGMAIYRYQELNIKDELIDLKMAPELIGRSRIGAPPKFMFNYTERGVRFPVYKEKHIVQLVFKQKWQAGKPFSNTENKELNQCFVAVADLFGMHARQISEKYYSVPEDERKKIERWLVQLLDEHKLIHTKKLNKAKKLLGK